jgi:acyl-CoA synthetase (NDP forming)
VVGNSTALAGLVSDACAVEGLRLVRLVDVGLDAGPDQLADAVRPAAADELVDAVIVVFVPTRQRRSGQEHAAALRAAAAGTGTAVIATFLGFDAAPEALAAPGPLSPMPGSIPAYPSPERAVRALARAVRYANWRRRPAEPVPELDRTNRAAGRVVVDVALTDAPSGRELDPTEAGQLLAAYGVDVVPARDVVGPDAAVSALAELGPPGAVRVGDAVRLYLRGAADVLEAWRSLGLAADARATVQRMAPRGVDVVMDLHDDRSFGALVSFGIGGVATELLGDRAYAVVPLTAADAAALIAGPRAAPLLTGYGGRAPADIAALAELALRLSALADDLPEVVELRLTAVAAPSAVSVLSAVARVSPSVPRADAGPRRLRGL